MPHPRNPLTLRVQGRACAPELAVRLLHDHGDAREAHVLGRLRGYWIVRFALGACHLFDPETGRGARGAMRAWRLVPGDTERLRARSSSPRPHPKEPLGKPAAALPLPTSPGQRARLVDHRTLGLPFEPASRHASS